MNSRARHWNTVYGSKDDVETSWFEPVAADSLVMLDRLGVVASDSVIDVGGGTSRLVDALLSREHREIAVLDIATDALRQSRERLGAAGDAVEWLVADVTTWRPSRRYRVWHDRAVFHFLNSPEQRAAYGRVMREALGPGGMFVVATFALAGPEQCSGLPVSRYDAAGLAQVLGPDIEVLESCSTDHVTPWGTVQPFTWVAGRLEA